MRPLIDCTAEYGLLDRIERPKRRFVIAYMDACLPQRRRPSTLGLQNADRLGTRMGTVGLRCRPPLARRLLAMAAHTGMLVVHCDGCARIGGLAADPAESAFPIARWRAEVAPSTRGPPNRSRYDERRTLPFSVPPARGRH
jgi:hypothetical protein